MKESTSFITRLRSETWPIGSLLKRRFASPTSTAMSPVSAPLTRTSGSVRCICASADESILRGTTLAGSM